MSSDNEPAKLQAEIAELREQIKSRMSCSQCGLTQEQPYCDRCFADYKEDCEHEVAELREQLAQAQEAIQSQADYIKRADERIDALTKGE